MYKVKFKGRWIEVYSTFHWNATERFFRGTIRGGISRSIKCDDSLAIVETYEETKSDRVGQHCPHG